MKERESKFDSQILKNDCQNLENDIEISINEGRILEIPVWNDTD